MKVFEFKSIKFYCLGAGNEIIAHLGIPREMHYIAFHVNFRVNFNANLRLIRHLYIRTNFHVDFRIDLGRPNTA